MDVILIDSNHDQEIIGLKEVCFRGRKVCVLIKHAGIEIYDNATVDMTLERDSSVIGRKNPCVVHHPLWITKIDTSLAKQLVGATGLPQSLDQNKLNLVLTAEAQISE